MQTNSYGLFIVSIAYSDTKQHGKIHEKNYSHIKFYNWRKKEKKKKKKKKKNKTNKQTNKQKQTNQQ
jgi:hypothetical protein